jgi:hypothetical protein
MATSQCATTGQLCQHCCVVKAHGWKCAPIGQRIPKHITYQPEGPSNPKIIPKTPETLETTIPLPMHLKSSTPYMGTKTNNTHPDYKAINRKTLLYIWHRVRATMS